MAFVNLLLISTFVAIFFTLHFAPIVSQEVEDESEFNYVVGDEHGPGKWGSIHKEWEACDNGELQSPIDLSDKRVEVKHEFGRMRRTYRPSNATMINRGHDIMMKWENGAGGLWLNGTEYTIRQMHWHSPSEHTVNNKSFILELHMFHQSADNKIAVVGILYKLGRPDSFLKEVEKHIHAVKDREEHEVVVGMANPKHIKIGSRKYYRYIGSLTTPPCTEGVVWTLVHKVRTVSKDQIKLLKDAVNDNMEANARPRQAIHGRVVGFYRPGTDQSN